MTSLFWLLIFGLALAGLLKSSSLLVQELQKLGKGFGISSFFMGMLVLSLSTSLPELVSSIWAVLTDYSSLVSATVVGSNITNLLLIIGVLALTKEVRLEKLKFPMGLWIGSTILLGVLLYDGSFSPLEGLLMLSVYFTLLHWSHVQDRGGFLNSMTLRLEGAQLDPRSVLAVTAYSVGVGSFSYLGVWSLENASELWNIAPSILGASLLAVGTSLPELTTSWVAFKKGDTEMAIGNLLGSNVFNASLIMAVASFFGALHVNNDVLVIGLPFLLLSTLLVSFSLMQGRVSRQEGWIYLLLFGVFQIQLFTAF